jgi:hypothetical protein
MLNNKQQQLYKAQQNTIIKGLNILLDKSMTDQSTINALFFSLGVALLKEPKVINTITKIFYPEDNYLAVREFFSELNLLLCGQAYEHKFITQLYNEGNSDSNEEQYRIDISQELSLLLKFEVKKWLMDKYKTGLFNKKDMLILYALHHKHLRN